MAKPEIQEIAAKFHSFHKDSPDGNFTILNQAIKYAKMEDVLLDGPLPPLISWKYLQQIATLSIHEEKSFSRIHVTEITLQEEPETLDTDLLLASPMSSESEGTFPMSTSTAACTPCEPENGNYLWDLGVLDNVLDGATLRQRIQDEEQNVQRIYNNLKKKGENQTQKTANITDYDLLVRFYEVPPELSDVCQRIFDAIDENGQGYLNGLQILTLLRVIVDGLTEEEEDYLCQILEIAGYNPILGADLQLFTVLVSLAQKISSIDESMKILLQNVSIEKDSNKYKEIWLNSVNCVTNQMSLDQLDTHLSFADDISAIEELSIIKKLKPLQSLDILDFMTFVPLLFRQEINDN